MGNSTGTTVRMGAYWEQYWEIYWNSTGKYTGNSTGNRREQYWEQMLGQTGNSTGNSTGRQGTDREAELGDSTWEQYCSRSRQFFFFSGQKSAVHSDSAVEGDTTDVIGALAALKGEGGSIGKFMSEHWEQILHRAQEGSLHVYPGYTGGQTLGGSRVAEYASRIGGPGGGAGALHLQRAVSSAGR